MKTAAASLAAGTASTPGLVAINWSSTITLGSTLIAIAVALAALAVLGYGARWKAAAIAADAGIKAERETRESFAARAGRLETELRETHVRNEELAELIGEQKRTIARLEALPNLERIIDLMASESRRADEEASRRQEVGLVRVGELFDERLDRHEDNASERHEAQLAALAGIAASTTRAAQLLAGRPPA